MAKQESETATGAAAVAVTPPPVRRGRKAAEVDTALIASMAELINAGDWAGDGKRYEDKGKANKAIVDYKRALADAGVSADLTSRTWEDNGAIVIAIALKDGRKDQSTA